MIESLIIIVGLLILFLFIKYSLKNINLKNKINHKNDEKFEQSNCPPSPSSNLDLN